MHSVVCPKCSDTVIALPSQVHSGITLGGLPVILVDSDNVDIEHDCASSGRNF